MNDPHRRTQRLHPRVLILIRKRPVQLYGRRVRKAMDDV